MNTTNLISTPNITGNVGSCEVKSVKEQTGNSFWTEQQTVVFSNSCTGQIIETNSYVTYGGVYIGIVVAVLLISFIIGASISDNSSY